MPITLNHSNISVQYSSDKSYIIETVKSDLYVRNENVDTVIRNNIQTAPVTPTTYVDSSGNVYAVESYTYSGTANTADYTRVFTNNTTCDILIVGGGGSGDRAMGGGGGGGAVLYATNISIPANTYTIKVGKGGENGKGGNSEAFGATCLGGGSTTFVAWSTPNNGTSGGSGSGGSPGSSGSATAIGGTVGTSTKGTLLNSGTLYNGNIGGNGLPQNPSSYAVGGGGGGGAGTAGLNSSQTTYTTRSSWIAGGRPSNGGDGVPINITGTTYYWGAGGGGGNTMADGGLGGGGGGGCASLSGFAGEGGINSGENGLNTVTEKGGNGGAGTGSGGGGGGYANNSQEYNGGNGGSGIVIIKYLLGTIPTTNFLTNEPVITVPTFTETIRTFVHSGGTEAQTTYNITVPQNTICDILIVGGGGGGGNGSGSGYEAGGGGAGGVVYMVNKTFTAGTYKINVGKGGTGGTSGNNSTITDNNNNTITFDSIQLIGKGGGNGATAPGTGGNGGSGGGGTHAQTNGGSATQGNTFWNGTTYVAGGYKGATPTAASRGGGGGGAGESGDTDGIGFGGDGIQVNISGTNTFYAGGGNAHPTSSSTARSDGGGGLVPAGNALSNTGSGGAGASGSSGSGGTGGSGIVIIKFKSNTNAAVSEGTPATTHKRLNFTYVPNYPIIQADTTNLKAWYKFDGNYNDSSSSGFNLTNSGAEIVDGLIEESVSTNGSDFLETSGINLNGKTYSISFWLKFNSSPLGDIFIFSQSSSYSPGLTVVFQYVGSLNVLRFSHYGSGNDMDTTGYNISNMIGTSWHHYVITYNNTNRGAEIWVDGAKLSTNISTLTNAFTGGGNFMIAKWQSNPVNSVNGLFEDFRYYDKILTSAEISQLYNIPSTNQYTLNFPVPTLTDINNNSNIVLRGAYDISLNFTNSSIIPKDNQYIPKPTTFTNYSVERMYPPVRNFTAATTTVSGQTYGNGTYVVSFSATFGGGLDPWTCFNTSITNGGHWTDRYTAGSFNSTSFIVSGYLGDWLKIQLPVAIKLTKFEFLMRNEGVQSLRDRSPKDFKIYGSNDNITWVELVNKTDAVYNASFKYEQTTPEITNTYTYYGLVVNKLFSSATVLNFDEWYIYGQEVLPSSLSLRYSLLNPILDPIGAQWTYSSNNTNVYHMGSVGIGTTSPEYSLDVRGTIFCSTGGYTQTGLTTWSIASDKRIKENIVKASYEKCLENVKNIELYNFNFKDNYVNTNDRRQLGFIAQEVQQVYPKAVEVGKIILNLEDKIDDLLTLNTTQIDYTLYGAVKGLIHKMENIKIKMEQIKGTSNITMLA